MMHDRQYVTRVMLEAGATESDTNPPTIYSDSSRVRLVGQWHRTADGFLICTWRHEHLNEMDDSHQRRPADLLSSKMNTSTRNVNQEREINAQPLRTLEFESNSPAAITTDCEAAVIPLVTQGGAQIVIQSVAITLLLAVAVLETFMCFGVEASGLF